MAFPSKIIECKQRKIYDDIEEPEVNIIFDYNENNEPIKLYYLWKAKIKNYQEIHERITSTGRNKVVTLNDLQNINKYDLYDNAGSIGFCFYMRRGYQQNNNINNITGNCFAMQINPITDNAYTEIYNEKSGYEWNVICQLRDLMSTDYVTKYYSSFNLGSETSPVFTNVITKSFKVEDGLTTGQSREFRGNYDFTLHYDNEYLTFNLSFVPESGNLNWWFEDFNVNNERYARSIGFSIIYSMNPSTDMIDIYQGNIFGSSIYNFYNSNKEIFTRKSKNLTTGVENNFLFENTSSLPWSYCYSQDDTPTWGFVPIGDGSANNLESRYGNANIFDSITFNGLNTFEFSKLYNIISKWKKKRFLTNDWYEYDINISPEYYIERNNLEDNYAFHGLYDAINWIYAKGFIDNTPIFEINGVNNDFILCDSMIENFDFNLAICKNFDSLNNESKPHRIVCYVDNVFRYDSGLKSEPQERWIVGTTIKKNQVLKLQSFNYNNVKVSEQTFNATTLRMKSINKKTIAAISVGIIPIYGTGIWRSRKYG